MAEITASGNVLQMEFDRTGYSDADLVGLYEALLLPRMIEEKMLILLRSGKVSKWFSGMGQEAIAVGSTLALNPTDYILPLHRNLGVFTGRNMELRQLFCQWQGKRDGFTKGRDRSFHFGSPLHRVIGMISHLGAMLPVANGISLASNLDGDDVISLVYSGDGGASEGDFHEAINVASVWGLPVIFLVENNGYGLSTPSSEQFRFKNFIDKAPGYGLEGHIVDGNNILAVHRKVTEIAAQMRQDRRPVLLECMTFRMRGHEEASGTKYVPKELFEEWAKKDPVSNYEAFLLSIGVLTPEKIQEIRDQHKAHINSDWESAYSAEEVVVEESIELGDVYAPSTTPLVAPDLSKQKELRFVDAVAEGLKQALAHDPKLIIMGQDIAEYGGAFKVTDGLVHEFGKGRIRNTPLCESAIVGSGLGLSLRGRPSVVEMQFADFVSCGFNQIVNNLAKTHYRWDHAVNVTVRMPTGAGSAAGPFHSQSNEAWFTKVPGLKVVFPSTPFDAKGLMTSALIEPNPVIFFEHKALYRSVSGMVPEGYYNLEIGKAKVVREGDDMTIVTYGWCVHWALDFAEAMKDEASIEVVDLRTLLPWDRETVYASVKKTGKCLVLHEDTITMGMGGEVAAAIAEDLFQWLDGPVMRVGSLDTPIPFTKALEDQFLPRTKFQEKARQLLAY